jgi:hypothetical protein
MRKGCIQIPSFEGPKLMGNRRLDCIHWLSPWRASQ